ncbi:MAG: 16S rRNA (guanine(527)-N(7))-methyltransferase RsmG [Caulobacteraceae bacterium]|nr:16S rRNA (guanine(527)-N(7))-methyltransferase RsmG [Caulobacteraceae bacterium]
MSGAATARPDPPALPGGFWERIGASQATFSDLDAFRRRLEEENRRQNLVGASTLADFHGRHLIDSAQLLWFAPGTLTWADLGSGAGLPGLVLAILLKGRPGARVHLIESMAKRCRFLAEVVAALDLPAEVHHARAETLAIPVERVTARACAPLSRLLGFAAPCFALGAEGLFLKGGGVDAEIAEAKRSWRFNTRREPSLSDGRGTVLAVTAVHRRGGR